MRYISITPLNTQDIVDIAIQYYGSMEGLGMLLADNPTLFDEGFTGWELGELQIRPNLTEMEGVDTKQTKQVKELLGVQGMVATHQAMPVIPSCGLVSMALFDIEPAQYDSQSNEFISLTIRLKEPLTVIAAITDITTDGIYDSNGSGILPTIYTIAGDGKSVLLEDSNPPTFLPAGLYELRAELKVILFDGSICNFNYSSFFHVF